MPKIFLKPGSAEFAEEKCTDTMIRCDIPGCAEEATHKAPKDRALSEHYSFCVDHIREYNKSWNFFEGMSEMEIEKHTLNAMYGDRPTQRYDAAAAAEDILKRKAWYTYHGSDTGTHTQNDEQKQDFNAYSHPASHTPEFKALALMGLDLPLTLPKIKTRYKELVKKHHPDLNKGCNKSEELLKQINIAYTVLKLAYGNFKNLPNRD